MTRRIRAAAATAVAVLLCGVLFVLTPGDAVAAAPKKCPRTTLGHDIKHADVVFRGRVQKAGKVEGSTKHPLRHYRVRADRLYRGSLVGRKVVVTARVGARACVAGLHQGKRYIVFANARGTRLMVSVGTAPATPSFTHQIVKRLGDGKQPTQPPPAAPEFTKVADANAPRLSRLLAPGAALLIISVLGMLVVGRLGRRTS